MSLSLAVRLHLLARAGGFRMTQVRPADEPSVRIDGPDPLRILVAGAGVAAAFGVTRWSDSMAGALAGSIARQTGRGVRVEVRAAPMLPARQVVAHLGPNGAHTCDAAVFTPCFLEASFAPGAGVGRHAPAIQRHLLDTGGPGLRRVVMLGVPRPTRFSRLNLAATKVATETNAAMRAQAAGVERVAWCEPPAFESLATSRPFDEGYYADLGVTVAEALVPALLERSPLASGRVRS